MLGSADRLAGRIAGQAGSRAFQVMVVEMRHSHTLPTLSHTYVGQEVLEPQVLACPLMLVTVLLVVALVVLGEGPACGHISHVWKSVRIGVTFGSNGYSCAASG